MKLRSKLTNILVTVLFCVHAQDGYLFRIHCQFQWPKSSETATRYSCIRKKLSAEQRNQSSYMGT